MADWNNAKFEDSAHAQNRSCERPGRSKTNATRRHFRRMKRVLALTPDAVEDVRDLVEKHREHCREKARERKLRLLDAMVPDRKCPTCGAVKLNPKSWVVMDRLLFAARRGEDVVRKLLSRARGARCCCCKGCSMRHFREEAGELNRKRLAKREERSAQRDSAV
jgi:hypothetical protein